MASNKVQTLNDSNFDEVLAAAEGPVLVEFTATWCGPCRVQAAVLERVAERNAELTIRAVDVDDYPELAARYGVRGIPTLVVFKRGKETGRRLGLAQEQTVVALVRDALRLSGELANGEPREQRDALVLLERDL